MKRLRKLFYFKIISGALIILLLSPLEGFPVAGKSLESGFKKAKTEYENGRYANAIIRLYRLAAVYENNKDTSHETRKRYGQIFLLIGACHEKAKLPLKAETFYEKGLWESPDSCLILQNEMKKLPVYKRVFKKLKKSKVITKNGKRKKKKKLLMWAGGAVALGIVLFLMIKKKKEKKTASIEISFFPNPVIRDSDEKWHYKITLKETNGVGVTLTKIDTTGNWLGGSPKDIFDTDYLPPHGTLTAYLVSSGGSARDTTYYIWGNDDNGNNNLEWQGNVTLTETASTSFFKNTNAGRSVESPICDDKASD